MDWNGIFKSLYEVVRVKVAVRNPSKIPPERMVVMRKKFYLLQFTVEWERIDIDKVMGLDDKDDDGSDDYEDDTLMDEEFQDLEKKKESEQPNKEKKDTPHPPSGGSVTVKSIKS